MILYRRDTFSAVGKWAFFIALLFAFSITAQYRIVIGGLLVHPYLMALPLAILFSGVKLLDLPRNVLTPLFIFLVIFSLACLQNSNPFSEIFKVIASLLTFLFFAGSVNSERDFRVISVGFIFCALIIAIQGILISESEKVSRLAGINALEGLGNKNAQSLFTLPAIFLSLLLSLKYFAERKFMQLSLVLMSLFVITISVFLSANRSGWLGLAIIFVAYLFYIGINLRLISLSIVVGLMVYVAINNYASDIVEHKQQQTEEGYASDKGRRMLAMHALEVGLENPILGVGMDELHRQMALRLGLKGSKYKAIDTHILWGYLLGSSGIFAVAAFIRFLYSLTKRYYPNKNFAARKALSKHRMLLIGFVVLFCIRGLFTREILYSPTFIGALGLLFSYYLFLLRDARTLAKA